MTLSRSRVFRMLAHSSTFGHLGLFVGTGFSIELTDGHAPSFAELLRRTATKLKIPLDLNDPSVVRGQGYPQLASTLRNAKAAAYRADGDSSPRRRATLDLKEAVADLCHLYPTATKEIHFRKHLGVVRPSWIITTNYDNILESVIDGVSVLPSQPLVVRPDYVPIYHLHGDRRLPESIIITEEDYVRLLGPVEYRQLKLSLLLTESTTLMLGYSYGDINVRSAAQWIRAFKNTHSAKRLALDQGQGAIVQALFVPNSPSPTPYRGPDGEIIVETNSIADFVAELGVAARRMRRKRRKAREAIRQWLSESSNAENMATDASVRADFATLVRESRKYIPPGALLDFLGSALDPVWERAREDGGFSHYDVLLRILLDLFDEIPVGEMHPPVFAYLAARLADLAYYIDPNGIKYYGKAWDAGETWQKAKPALSATLLKQLASYAREQGQHWLQQLVT